MTKLYDTQLLVLSAAAQRDDRNVLPLPGSLRGGTATKVVGALSPAYSFDLGTYCTAFACREKSPSEWVAQVPTTPSQ